MTLCRAALGACLSNLVLHTTGVTCGFAMIEKIFQCKHYQSGCDYSVEEVALDPNASFAILKRCSLCNRGVTPYLS